MNTKLATDARSTVNIQRKGFYMSPHGKHVEIADALKAAQRNTKLVRPEDFPTALTLPEEAPTFETQLSVTSETTLQAAARLAAEGIEPLCLNFASAKNPGGGFLNGATAQEESLARASGLYSCLLTKKEFYDFHRQQGDLLYSDHMIVSPGVPVFADDHRRLFEAPYLCGFLTSPAVNTGVIKERDAQKLGLIRPTMLRRAHRLLWLAQTAGYTHLVLGAWGCGVFRCDPTMVAGVFSALLTGEGPLAGAFEQVVFAVYDRSKEATTRAAFEKALTDY
jgi:uncharacterized protein (TIGR02452 family)